MTGDFPGSVYNDCFGWYAPGSPSDPFRSNVVPATISPYSALIEPPPPIAPHPFRDRCRAGGLRLKRFRAGFRRK